MAKRWFLGAYAGFANLSPELKTSANESEYRQGLEALPHLRGLELPFYHDLHETDVEGLIAWLPRAWDYIITCLPGTMNSLQENADYGLASRSEFGRKSALDRLQLVRRRILELHSLHGRASVLAVEVHSAPRGDKASLESLTKSLETVLSWDWGGAAIIVEHCDAWHADGEFSKGFLSLHSELMAIGKLPIGIGLNWGRSVLEGRRVETIHRHLELADQKLKSLFFSGTAISDPLYGTWQDNHAAIRLDSSEMWESSGSLLTEEAIEDTYSYVKVPDPLLGLKVQPFPTNLTIDQRLNFLRQQLESVNRAYKSV